MPGENISGLHIFGQVPPISDADLFATTGRVFWVGSTAVPGGVVGVDDSGSYGHSPKRPFATIDYAIGQTTASRGDAIVVLPGHAETTTAAITVDVAGLRIIGLGLGRNRPAITANFSSAGHTINVTAANTRLHNLRLVASSAAQTSQIRIAAADCSITNCVIEQGGSNVVSGDLSGGVLIGSGAQRFKIFDCLFRGTAAGPDYAICFDNTVATANVGDDWEVRRCTFNYNASSGLDLAGIYADLLTTGFIVEDCMFLGMDATAVDFNSIASAGIASDGIIKDIAVVPTSSVATIANLMDLGGAAVVGRAFVHNAQDDTSSATIPSTTAS